MKTTVEINNTNLTANDEYQMPISAKDIEIYQTDIHEEASDHIFLSIHLFQNKLGLSFYSSLKTKIFLLKQIYVQNNNFKFIDGIIQQIRPNTIIISTMCDDILKKRLEKCLNLLHQQTNEYNNSEDLDKETASSLSNGTNSFENVNLSKNIHILPHHFFSLEDAKKKIIWLDFPKVPSVLPIREKYFYLSSFIDYSDTILLQSLGALIKYLEMKRKIIAGLDSFISIEGISYVFLEDLMFVDRYTYYALQIFSADTHPSVYKQGKGKKEGLSLFSLFDRCVSRVGKLYMKSLFYRPSRNIHNIQERLDLVEYFLNQANPNSTDFLKTYLKHIHDTNLIIRKMKYADLTLNDWNKLNKTLQNIICIGESLNQVKRPLPLFQNIICLISQNNISKIAKMISGVIDFKESFKTDRIEIKEGFSNELDEKKQTYKKLPETLSEIGIEEYLRYQNIIPSCVVVYVSQIGYLLRVPLNHNMIESVYDSVELEFVYKNEKEGYFRTPRTKQMDNALGDIFTEIYDIQRIILNQLQVKILNSVKDLDQLICACAKLDCFIAFAETSALFKYVRPNFNEENIIDIQDGRHPLQELFTENFVTNNFTSSNSNEKTKIISGPNACGKSIYLKQVCLIIYMAQIGSFIPAKYASLPLVDRLFTIIKTIESFSSGLSSFIMDLRQMVLPLNESTSHSIVAIDEFGKGTDPISGISLLCSFINFLEKPHLIVLTHFNSLEKFIKRPVTYFTFKVNINDEIIYKYKLINGKNTSSLAHLIAKSVGISEKVIERAEEIKNDFENHKKITALVKPDLIKMAEKFLKINELFQKAEFDENFDYEGFLETIRQA